VNDVNAAGAETAAAQMAADGGLPARPQSATAGIFPPSRVPSVEPETPARSRELL
jgi:hypothetical protein